MPFEMLCKEEEGRNVTQIFRDIKEIHPSTLLAISSLRTTACCDKDDEVREFDAGSSVSDLTDLSESSVSVSSASVDQVTETDGDAQTGQDDTDDPESVYEPGDIERHWTRKKGVNIRLVERSVPDPVQKTDPAQETASDCVRKSAPAPVTKPARPPLAERSNSFHCAPEDLDPAAIRITCDALFENVTLIFAPCEVLLDRSDLISPQFGDHMSRAQLRAMAELRSKAFELRDDTITRWAKQQGESIIFLLTNELEIDMCLPILYNISAKPKPLTHCDVSTAYLESPQGRRRHLLTHYPEGIFCPVCMRIFARECSLDRHLAVKNESCLDTPGATRFLLGRTPEGKIARGLSRRVFNLYYLGVMEDFPMPEDHFKTVSGRNRNSLIHL